MAENERCPNCGAEMPANAPQGLCPACLFQQGLRSDVTDPPSSIPPDAPDPAATKTYKPVVNPDGTETTAEGGAILHYFGDYELIKKLGWGGMGVVYKARQISLNRPVALKLLKSAILASDDERRRFQNEAEAVALLDHPHIVPIFEVGEYKGRQFFSMKLVGGPSLEKKLSDYTSDPKAAAKLVKTASEAVHHAHERGILHRDLKPSNILLDERGEPYVTDFGLAKRVEGDSELTVSGAILGTPPYMAPEQTSGRRGAVTTATDVYGLGAILYALLTGRAPFQSESVVELLNQVRDRMPERPSRLNRRTPHDLEIICLKCLEKNPSRRYVSAQALADDLLRYVGRYPIVARRASRARRLWLWCCRRPIVAASALLVLIALFAGLVASLSIMRNRALALRFANEQELAFRRKYDFAIRRVQEAWEVSDLRQVSDLLRAAVIPQDPTETNAFLHQEPEIDPSGFELNFSRQRSGSGHEKFRGRTSLAFSPDGRFIVFPDNGSYNKIHLHSVTGNRSTVFVTRQEVRGNVSIRSVRFSPDGARVATGYADGLIQLWNPRNAQVSLEFPGHTRSVTCLAFSPDGQRLASASADSTVRVWEAATGKETLCFKGHTDRVSSIAFSPDGTRITSASYDGTIRIWDPVTGRANLVIQGDSGPVLSVSFSPDGRHLAAVDSYPGVRMWDTATGQVTSVLGSSSADAHRCYTCVAFSPDGRRLAAACTDQSLRIWDASDGRELLALKGRPREEISSLAFSPDGTKLAAARGDDVNVWDAIRGQEPPTFRGRAGPVYNTLFSPDGSRLVTTGQDEFVRIWEVSTGEVKLSLRGPVSASGRPVLGIAYSPDDTRLAVSGDDGVMVWNAISGQRLLHYKGHSDDVNGVAFAPDGKRIISASLDSTIKIWDASTGREEKTIQATLTKRLLDGNPVRRYRIWSGQIQGWGRPLDEHKPLITRMVVSPDGRWIGCLDKQGIVHVWDARTGAVVWTIDAFNEAGGRAAASLTFSPDGSRLAIVNQFGSVSLCHASTGQEIRVLENHDENTASDWGEGALSAVFSPDGRRIAVAHRDGKVGVRDAATGKVLLEMMGHPNDVPYGQDDPYGQLVAFAPDGQRIVSAGKDGAILWDAASGAQIRSFNGHPGRVSGVVYYPDGTRFATCGDGGKVRVWDDATLKEVMILNCHDEGVKCVAISADGTRLATGGNQTVKLWNSATGQEIHTFRGYTGYVKSVAFSPDGRFLATVGQDKKAFGVLKVWEADTDRVLLERSSRQLLEFFYNAAFSPDGRSLAVSRQPMGDDRGSLIVIDVASGRERYRMPGTSKCVKAVFSPDGTLIAAARDGFVTIEREDDGRFDHFSSDPFGSRVVVNDVTFSPDGGRLATAHDDGSVRVWDTATGLETLTLKGETGPVESVAFRPDGRRLLSAGADGKVVVWDAGKFADIDYFTPVVESTIPTELKRRAVDRQE